MGAPASGPPQALVGGPLFPARLCKLVLNSQIFILVHF